MAKKDIINRIVENYPDSGYTREQLNDDFTIQELENLERTLEAGTPGSEDPDEGDRPEAEAEVNEEGIPTDLSETEKEALTVQQKSAQGEEINQKYKLSNPETQYAEEGFTLTGEEEKELPANPSAELIERIRTGFIVKAD
jgi:hypothetical protein